MAGCIFYVADVETRLPGGGRERRVHEERRAVLIVSDQGDRHSTNAMPANLWPSVLVVPISSTSKYKTIFDVYLPKGEGNLSKEGWARVPAIQMIDKDFLEDMTGQVRTETLDQVTAQILNYLGIISPGDPESDVEETGGF